MSIQLDAGHLQAKKKGPRKNEIYLPHIDLWPSSLQKCDKFLLFKPQSLEYFVMAAQAKKAWMSEWMRKKDGSLKSKQFRDSIQR